MWFVYFLVAVTSRWLVGLAGLAAPITERDVYFVPLVLGMFWFAWRPRR